jgi:membrane dipeptidase
MRSDYFGRVSSKGLENVSRFPHLFAELVRLGFYERDIAKITSGNMRCVLRRVEAIGGQLRKARPRPSAGPRSIQAGDAGHPICARRRGSGLSC